ncbi:retinoblastoma-binding protein 5 homolog, partial [Drosophila guanche]|uniref:retinoblastoma-binding protein 5 homolog n=1 Tax=Drosophila guanche TaxID=7266 RepID=UPI00147144CB
VERSHTIIPHDEDSEFDILSTFDRRGEYIFSGNTKGRIQVVRVKPGTIDIEVVTSFRVSHAAIKQIEFAPRNKNVFLVNSADRTIRVYDFKDVLNHGRNGSESGSDSQTSNLTLSEPEPIQRLMDLVNRTTWKKCCFSGGQDSDYICAVSAKNHSLYVWERNVGSLLKILVGTKGETLSDVVWHPVRPVIVSIASGILSIWSSTQVENWSAFAPDFKELEENIEYEERESEFDDEDDDRSITRAEVSSLEDEEIEVDVEQPPKIDAFLSSDEEEEDQEALIYFPISVDIDDTEMDGVDEN